MAYRYIGMYGFSGVPEQDLCDEDYYRFIDVCFRCSSYFSLLYLEGLTYLKELQPDLILVKNVQEWPGIQSLDYCHKHRFAVYKCNDDTKQVLKTQVSTLFSWEYYQHGKPEDLAFYRKDKTVFFYQVSHEDMAILLNREGEDVREIINDKWRHTKETDSKMYF